MAGTNRTTDFTHQLLEAWLFSHSLGIKPSSIVSCRKNESRMVAKSVQFVFRRFLMHLCVTLVKAFHKQCVYQLGDTEDVP